MKSIFHSASLIISAFGMTTAAILAISIAPTLPLSERVEQAEKIFVGTVIERVEEGEWVRAVLRVDEPLREVGENKKVEVIWRTRVGNQAIYNAVKGQRGIAILDAKHEGRYWLRADKFEPPAKLEEVRELIAAIGAKRVPSFDEWVKAGKPIPNGMVFPGGTPWFDESNGKQRPDKEVYEMIHGGAAEKPNPPEPRLPAHWGTPPPIQTRDLRPLPGGYGEGSTTLANWIEKNMKEDAEKAKVPE